MELRAVVVLRVDVVEKVGDGLRRGRGVELDDDLAGGGVELDLRVGGERGQRQEGGGGDEERGCGESWTGLLRWKTDSGFGWRVAARPWRHRRVRSRGARRAGPWRAGAPATAGGASSSRTSLSFVATEMLLRSSAAARSYWFARQRRVQVAQVLVRDRPVGRGDDRGLQRHARRVVVAATEVQRAEVVPRLGQLGVVAGQAFERRDRRVGRGPPRRRRRRSGSAPAARADAGRAARRASAAPRRTGARAPASRPRARPSRRRCARPATARRRPGRAPASRRRAAASAKARTATGRAWSRGIGGKGGAFGAGRTKSDHGF